MRTRWATLTVASGLVLAGCGSADEGTTASAPSSAAEEVRTVERAMGTAEVTGTPSASSSSTPASSTPCWR